MAARISRRALRSLSSRLRPFTTQRTYSSSPIREQTAFSYSIPVGTKLHYEQLFESISKRKVIANPAGHNAAVLLATPDFARTLEDEEFMSQFVKTMSASAQVDQFHVLGAIVDHVAPPVGSYKPIQGISVLRGHLDDMLPQLWETAPPKSQDDADTVSALSFKLGKPHHAQQVTWSPDRELQVVADLGLFAPLVPLTSPRAVTESFGNIIRGIEVEGKSIPASTELEEAVNALHKHSISSGIMSGPVGVWAVVTPYESESSDLAEWLENGPDPIVAGQDVEDVKDLTRATATHLRTLYGLGGRFYKILSGGGGWGAKKGLLSLDPQQTHFALSEEEQMAGFMKTMSDSGFTPRGSRIQFFMSAPALPEVNRPLVPGIAFGVSGETSYPEDPEAIEGFIGGHFGALSNHAVFLSGPGSPNGEGTKLSVPHSQIFAADEDRTGESDNSILGNLVPDVGSLAVFGWAKAFL
ncbi:hypothetical protein PT974_08615 [Cladobotryum mycophilum]|uniref:Uncharacterized protein n=1 Tax=Cladobotryum mycophilum TaxID=491253 RepID=A0ABR0SDW4_9HYPO